MNKKSGIISYRSCSLLVAVVFYLQFVVSFAVKRLWSVWGADAPDGLVYIIITQIFAVGLPCLMMAVMEKADFKREFSLKRINFKNILYCTLLGVAVQPLAMLVNIPLQRLAVRINGQLPPAVAESPDSLWQVVAMLFVVCLVPAFFEELLVRGMLLNSVKMYGVFKALAVTAVIFALLHNDLSSLVGLLMLGGVLGFCVLMTGSVVAGMVAHFAFNATGVAIDFFMNKYPQINSMGFLSLFASMGAVVAVVVMSGIYNKKEVSFMEANSVDRSWASFINIPIILVVVGCVVGGLL